MSCAFWASMLKSCVESEWEWLPFLNLSWIGKLMLFDQNLIGRTGVLEGGDGAGYPTCS